MRESEAAHYCRGGGVLHTSCAGCGDKGMVAGSGETPRDPDSHLANPEQAIPRARATPRASGHEPPEYLSTSAMRRCTGALSHSMDLLS
ncbi:MAG: hypothetical protein ACFFD2_03740 [Promethearchaeota archaeon]